MTHACVCTCVCIACGNQMRTSGVCHSPPYSWETGSLTEPEACCFGQSSSCSLLPMLGYRYARRCFLTWVLGSGLVSFAGTGSNFTKPPNISAVLMVRSLKTRSYYCDLQPLSFLPLFPKCQDCRHIPTTLSSKVSLSHVNTVINRLIYILILSA